MSKILLSGVPGTGKSTVANHLAAAHGFFHLDMEQDEFAPRFAFNQNPTAFLGELTPHQDVVLSWGFDPYGDVPAIKRIRAAGFTLVWLDGNRVASLRAFLRREKNDPALESTYYGQMQRIIITDVVEKLRPIVISPFTKAGAFRPVAQVADSILAALADAQTR